MAHQQRTLSSPGAMPALKVRKAPAGSRAPATRLVLVGALAAVLILGGCSDPAEEARRHAVGSNPSLAEAMKAADPIRGARLFRQCAACHTIGEGADDRAGPNLFGVMGKPIAGASGRYGYSAALASAQGRWTPQAMNAWLTDPEHFAPGTRMLYRGLDDPLDRADVIAFLQSRAPRSPQR